MATYATLTVNAEDIIGADFDPSRASVWIEANTPHSAIVVDGQTLRVGGRSEKFVNGVATFQLITTNSADNPTSFSYRGHITYVEKGSRGQGRQALPISDFPLTANANLAAIEEAWDGLSADPIWRSDFRDEMLTIRDQTEAIAVGDLSGTYAGLGDALAIQRIDRQNVAKARAGGGAATIAYSDATELTKDWADLSGWQAATNAQVSGNKLYAVSAANPGGALKSFPVGSGETAHIAGLLYWKAGGTGAAFFGLDTAAADHAPVASSPDGIFLGFNTAGVGGVFTGSNNFAIAPTLADSVGANPTVDTTFAWNVDVGDLYVSFTMRKLGDPAWIRVAYINRSAFVSTGKAINNVSLFLQDARGTGGHGFGPVVAVKSRQPARTKALGGQAIEGADHRLIATASSAGGDPWRIQLPSTYDPRRPSPVVIWCHQSLSGTATSPWTEARMQPLTDALSDAGYIFAAASDSGDRWGNAASLANYAALYERIRDHFNTGPVFLIGVSMGALPALNLIARRTFPTPAAFVSIGGVCNLDDLWANATYDDGIATAYGISGPDAPDAEYETKTAGFNPIDRAGWEFRGVPMRFYTSTGDTAVPKATGCDVLAAKVSPYAPEATVSVKSGGHLDVSQYPPSEIVAFFESYR